MNNRAYKVILVSGHDYRCPGAKAGKFIEHFEVKKINALVESALPENIRLLHLTSDIVNIKKNCQSESLKWKVKIINKLKPDFAIETHLNSYFDPEVDGCETLYYPTKNNKELATILQKALVSSISNKDRGVKPRKDLYFLKRTKCPAFIIEPLFISSPKGQHILRWFPSSIPEGLVARGIIEGILALKNQLLLPFLMEGGSEVKE